MSETIDQSSERLTAWGRISWAEARQRLAGATCVWADLDGLQRGAAPEAAPITTHLWAWKSGTAWRLRVDGEVVIGAELSTQGLVPEQLSSRPIPEPELGDLVDEILADVGQLTTAGPSPITFLIEK
jgi:hypothetical protein